MGLRVGEGGPEGVGIAVTQTLKGQREVSSKRVVNGLMRSKDLNYSRD